MSRREFQFQDGTAHKFWAIEVNGSRFTVQFGRVGTAGRTQTKDFGSDAEAQTAADKLIAEKRKKGYTEVQPSRSPAEAATVRKTAPPVEAALDHLRTAQKKGHADILAAQLKATPAEVVAKATALLAGRPEQAYPPLDAKSTPPALHNALFNAMSPAPLVSWATPANLPPLLVGGRRMSDRQVVTILSALNRSLLAAPDPLLRVVKEHADRAALDAFVWRLFELWLANGAPSKEKWAFLSLGHLGGDATALKLTPLLRVWPGESQHQRAVTGLECLRAMGTDTALIQLNGIAQRLKFKGLQNKAREFMEAIAKDRNLTVTIHGIVPFLGQAPMIRRS